MKISIFPMKVASGFLRVCPEIDKIEGTIYDEGGHHGVADRLNNIAVSFADDTGQEREMLANKPIGARIVARSCSAVEPRRSVNIKVT